MASVFNFKCTEQTQNGSDLVLNITKASQPTQLQVVCKSGEIIVEGELGTILGVPTAPVSYTDGQAFNLNEMSYKNVTITIKDGTNYQLFSNQ